MNKLPMLACINLYSHLRSVSVAATLALTVMVLVSPSVASAQIINIDFLANRGGQPVSPNYVGTGAAGGGTVFNGLIANNSGLTDNISASGTGLLDSVGVATGVSFSIAPIGADNVNGFINGGYLFINSANSYPGYPAPYAGGFDAPSNGVQFTITGLGSVTSVDLYFYADSGAGFSFNGTTAATPATFTPTGIYTTANTLEFTNVAVSGGVVNGTFYQPSGLTEILNGVTVVVPEPSTWTMVVIGSFALAIAYRVRRQAA